MWAVDIKAWRPYEQSWPCKQQKSDSPVGQVLLFVSNDLETGNDCTDHPEKPKLMLTGKGLGISAGDI